MMALSPCTDSEVRGNTATQGTGNGGGILNSDGGTLTVHARHHRR